MNDVTIALAGARLHPLPSGALFWPEADILCVSDLHLGKSERMARRGGSMLPPYETVDTLSRLESDLTATGAGTVICLGDSFDDRAAADGLRETELLWIARLQAGRRWIWIEGNHDPGPLQIAGTHRADFRQGPLLFRHIADPAGAAEISGHYHPKAAIEARGRRIVRPCFLHDATRAILPAYGTYTGGLAWTDACLTPLFPGPAQAILLGQPLHRVPHPGFAACTDSAP